MLAHGPMASPRLRSLQHLDTRAVALPHGTEVTTRVERVVGERRVPQGSVGRVTKIEGDAVDVTLVGVGVVRYARDEVIPRRVGQALYAVRRADAWQLLRPCVVLESTVGSRAWGLADEGSDTDLRGVFAYPFTLTTGLVEPPEDLVSEDGSATYWNAKKAMMQALRADPNTLEMLFLPNARACDPIGEWLLAERDAFVSREIHGTFGRYALGQLRRLSQGMRLHEHRSLLLAWLREDPSLDLDTVAGRLADRSAREYPSRRDAVAQAKEHVKQLYRSLSDQGLLPESTFVALVAFAGAGAADLELSRELRPKNAYNLLRLLALATSWLTEGSPTFEAKGAFRDRLLAIKRGQVELDTILAEAEAMVPMLEAAKESSKLPARADIGRVDKLLRRVNEEVARRFANAVDGPFGAGAPEAPIAEWAD